MNHEPTDGEKDLVGSEPADLSKLLRGIRGDKVLLSRLIENFLSDYPPRMAAIGRAIAAGDASSAERAAHGLRGSLLLFGAGHAVELASAIEELGRLERLPEAGVALDRLETELQRLWEYLGRHRTTAP